MDTQNCGLDLDHLARQTMGDEELQKQVLSLFVSHMSETMPRLVSASEEASQIAHSIKGSARGIGAWSVASAAEAVEKACGDRSSEILVLKGAVDRTMLEIASLLEKE
ncbi:Hpt domain-containing protein [Cohaesibacter marisflavi]|uniref:Hpt domain-containing protein n=1 Tax=Cohaesibacter marisflavi TaxID=655353 RepID=A0A1I5J0U9_9HYPH|nr:Hpt domain-containing protein [Cohaesibacter marisflavi]SFO66001.1 Hpt domain-containing protein [Cohaesibacter marisflavi]